MNFASSDLVLFLTENWEASLLIRLVEESPSNFNIFSLKLICGPVIYVYLVFNFPLLDTLLLSTLCLLTDRAIILFICFIGSLRDMPTSVLDWFRFSESIFKF